MGGSRGVWESKGVIIGHLGFDFMSKLSEILISTLFCFCDNYPITNQNHMKLWFMTPSQKLVKWGIFITPHQQIIQTSLEKPWIFSLCEEIHIIRYSLLAQNCYDINYVSLKKHESTNNTDSNHFWQCN
jgi:hypothetical protein